MAILKMDKIRILGLKSQKSDILTYLQKEGLVELVDLYISDSYHDNQKNYSVDDFDGKNKEGQTLSTGKVNLTEKNQKIQRNQLILEAALKILEEKFPGISLASKDLKLDINEFLAVCQREKEIITLANTIVARDSEYSNISSQLVSLKKEQVILKDWLAISFNPYENETARTKFYVGAVSNQYLGDLQNAVDEADDPTTLVILDSNEDVSYVSLIVLKGNELEADYLMKQNHFNSYPISKIGIPKDIYEKNQQEIQILEEGLEEIEVELKEFAEKKLEMYVLLDYYQSQLDKNQANEYTENTKSSFLAEGFLPEKEAERIKTSLEKNFTVLVEIETLADDAEYPILLKNEGFNGAYQNILEMFGAPHTGEIDPTPGLAPFAFIFFGMMLSDVGYGLLMSIFCAYLLWKVKIDTNTESGGLVRMLFLSGISSAIWGFVFGGFFGDLLTVFSDGRINFPMLWFNPMDEPQKLLIWSMIFGVIHLFAGMAMKIVNEIKFGKISNIIFDVVPWYFLITGLGLWLAGGSLDVTTIDLAQIGKYLAIAGAVIILLFAGRDKKNPIVRLFSGIGGLYGVINYLGDILSYTRVLALVLATSVIATVVNFLAKMVSGSFIGVIFAILILLGGHGLNLALSGLSAYVHSNRLQYVEFFGQFFEGGGTFFKPLTYRTKHVKLNKD